MANFDENKTHEIVNPRIKLINAPITRKISLISDLHALLTLFSIFKANKFDAVHSVTPKAGLLSMVAAKIAGVSNRHHTFTGQVWATKSGLSRFILKLLDKITFTSSSFALVDSPSQRDFLISEKVIKASDSCVLADGSISGVDTSRFHPNPEMRKKIRNQHDISEDSFVFLYLGRLNREKGIQELIQAFSMLKSKKSKFYMMLVGPDEEEIIKRLEHEISAATSYIVTVGYTKTPEHYMSAADVFCLPSHREGFGTVILEAAASGIPAIGSNIYGVSDAISDGITGLLHEKKCHLDLAKKMQQLLDDRSLTKALGNNALNRAQNKFSSARVTDAMVRFYKEKIPGEATQKEEYKITKKQQSKETA
ncbi:putative glycosyltransferase EpsD [compost metagenome]